MSANLTEDERQLLATGLLQWGGPARPTDELAVALGFADAADLIDESARLSELLAQRKSLSPIDLARALAATEVAFASDVFGAGVEWTMVTGLTDEETLRILRRLQRKLVGEYEAFFAAQ